SIRNLPEVASATTTHFYPGQPSISNQPAYFGPSKDSLSLSINYVGLDYFTTLGIRIIQGRNFSSAHAMDTVNAAIINEKAAEALGLQNPLGERINTIARDYTIIGIVKDNYNAGYTSAIRPEIYVNGTVPKIAGGRHQLLIQLKSGKDAKQAVEKI